MEHPHKIEGSASDRSIDDCSVDDRQSPTHDRRREPRIKAELPIQVWGVDTWGKRFLQQAHARDISLSGALVSGLDSELRSGDVIGILYAGKQARYRVVWVRHSESADKVQAAVHRFAVDECPWKELLVEVPAGEGRAASLSPVRRD
jgi:hypothetical protein